MNTILLEPRAKETLTALSNEVRERAFRALERLEHDELPDAVLVNPGSSHQPVYEVYRESFRFLFSFVERKPGAHQIVLYSVQEWLVPPHRVRRV